MTAPKQDGNNCAKVTPQRTIIATQLLFVKNTGFGGHVGYYFVFVYQTCFCSRIFMSFQLIYTFWSIRKQKDDIPRFCQLLLPNVYKSLTQFCFKSLCRVTVANVVENSSIPDVPHSAGPQDSLQSLLHREDECSFLLQWAAIGGNLQLCEHDPVLPASPLMCQGPMKPIPTCGADYTPTFEILTLHSTCKVRSLSSSTQATGRMTCNMPTI